MRPIAHINRATNDSKRHWTPLDLKAGSIVWAIKRLRGYCWGTKFRIISDHKAFESIGEWEITMRASTGGSSFSLHSTKPSSTARAAPTKMPISCPVCPSLPRNTTAVGLAASSPSMMAAPSSSGPVGFALVPHRPPVLAWVDWFPSPIMRFWLDSLSRLRIFVTFARTGHV